MKTQLLISVLALFFHAQTHANMLQINLPFGSKERIIKIRELPDVNAFQLKDGTYYDIGSMYTKKQFLWLGYSYGEPEYVGYINSQEKYVPLTSDDLNKVASLAMIQLPQSPQISFFDTYVSRLILLIILSVLTYYGYIFFKKRKAKIAANIDAEMPSWPPTATH